MIRQFKLFVATICFVALGMTHAVAFQVSGFRPEAFRDIPKRSSPLREGHTRSAPAPFLAFCRAYPGDCQVGSASSVTMTPEKFAELDAINHHVNTSIHAQMIPYAGHQWTLNASVGDCNEFAVQKRHDLIQAGWPAAALALTIVRTPWGEGHLVVTVRSDQGDLVLDSLRPNIVGWDQTRYEWIMRQSASDPTDWVAIAGSRFNGLGHRHHRRPQHALPEVLLGA